jgi:hypothetical protein
MKVSIGPYKNWFGPYQLAELLCFWVKKVPDEYGIERHPEWVHAFGEWLAHGSVREKTNATFKFCEERDTTALYRFLLWVDSKRKRKIKVRIDRFDTWSMDDTLAHIILPMLKQLHDTKHGYPHVEEIDVPERLRIYDPSDDYNYDQQQLFEYNPTNPEHISVKSDQWDWVLGEMIYAFEHLVDRSWEDKYSSGNWDMESVPCDWDEQGKPRLYKMQEGANHTHKTDTEGLQSHWKRIDNGLHLFGKYYRNLWD